MSAVEKKNELILPQRQHKARGLHGARFSAHRHRVFCCVFFFGGRFWRTFRAPARPVIFPPLFHHFFFNEAKDFVLIPLLKVLREAINSPLH